MNSSIQPAPASAAVHDLTFDLLLSPAQIQQRVAQMGADLREAYRGKTPVFIGVLNGAFVFAADLLRAYGAPCEIAFTKLASYSGVASTGEVKTLIGLDMPLEGRDVVVVEDIVDTGKTLHVFLQTLRALQPASISLAAFLVKPEALQHRFEVDHVGFEIPNRFVVGYGLDYNGQGRQLAGLYQLAEKEEKR